MKRRTFLTMLGLAPAAPALAKTAIEEPSPFEGGEIWGEDVKLGAFDTSYVVCGSDEGLRIIRFEWERGKWVTITPSVTEVA